MATATANISNSDRINIIKDIYASAKDYAEGNKQLATIYTKQIEDTCHRLIRRPTKQSGANRGTLHKYISKNNAYKKPTELLDLKRKLDTAVLLKVVYEFLRCIIKGSSEKINKLAISLNKGNVYVWIEIADNEHEKSTEIDSITKHFNAIYNNDDIQIIVAIHEKFMGIELPDNYVLIPIKM